MALPATTFRIDSFTFNTITYDNANGGPKSASWSHESVTSKSKSGADVYNTQNFTVEKNVRLTIRTVDPVDVPELDTTGAVVLTAAKAGGTVTITLANMKLISVSSVQDADSPSSAEWVFEDLSTDGTTNPIS